MMSDLPKILDLDFNVSTVESSKQKFRVIVQNTLLEPKNFTFCFKV